MPDVRHDSSITEFQQKRGGDSAAFFLPFLTPDVTLLDVGCGPGTITAALAEIVGMAIGVDIESNAIATANRLAARAGLTNLAFVEGNLRRLFTDRAGVDHILDGLRKAGLE